MSTIAEQRAKIQSAIADWTALLTILQTECEHVFAKRQARRASGYDYESFWYDCHCEDCGKHWREDQP